MDGDEMILELKNKLIDIPMGSIVQQSFEDIKTIVEDANILQLEKGMKSDGTFMPDYSNVSVTVYGKPPGPIKLYDTGAFYRGVIMTTDKEGIELTSGDVKTEMLEEKYGDEILGLTEENKDRITSEDLMYSIDENLKKYFMI